MNENYILLKENMIRSKKILLLSAIMFFPLGSAYSKPQIASNWTNIVSQCSIASSLIIPIYVASHSKDKRIDLSLKIVEMIDSLPMNSINSSTPSASQIVFTQASAETLLEAGANPSKSQEGRDWFISQISGTCVAKSFGH